MKDSKPNIGELGWRATEIHPLAALFPMLPPDDLASLADHIKENGLQTPIVIDCNGVLIDGRNRQTACEMAGVEPRYEQLNGHDPEAFIWGANGKRRQMDKGQMAMVAAMAFTVATTVNNEPRERGREDTGKAKAAAAAGVSAVRLSHALAVKEHAPHLVDEVITGAVKLDSAYTTAQSNKKEKDWRDDGIRMLREQDADLAQRVVGGELDLATARQELDDRKRARHAMRDSVLMGLASMISSASGFEKSTALKELPIQLLADEGVDHLRQYFKGGHKEVSDKLLAARRGLEAVEQIWASINRK